MNLNQLRYFETLAECEHCTLAAEKLNISQSSLSKSMASLEEELGVYLFERVGRSIQLTKAGRRYLENVRPLLNRLDEAGERLRREQAMSEGYIDIGMITSIENNEFVDWLRGFRAQNPARIFYSCLTDISAHLIDGLKQRQFDLIFCTALQPEKGIRFEPVCRKSMVIVLPEKHRWNKRESIDIQELAGIGVIRHAPNCGMRQVTDDMLKSSGITVKSISGATEDRTLISLVRAGVGPAIMTDSCGIRMEGVRVIPLTGIAANRVIYMGWRRDKEPQEAARQFRDYILEQVKPDSSLHSAAVL